MGCREVFLVIVVAEYLDQDLKPLAVMTQGVWMYVRLFLNLEYNVESQTDCPSQVSIFSFDLGLAMQANTLYTTSLLSRS